MTPQAVASTDFTITPNRPKPTPEFFSSTPKSTSLDCEPCEIASA